jgi:YgiT-type zinc finger domain-containing protein
MRFKNAEYFNHGFHDPGFIQKYIGGQSSQPVDKCFQCNNVLTTEHATLKRTVKGEVFLVEDVPGQVCHKCGERYYDGPVMERIEALLLACDIDRELRIPVMKYKVA